MCTALGESGPFRRPCVLEKQSVSWGFLAPRTVTTSSLVHPPSFRASFFCVPRTEEVLAGPEPGCKGERDTKATAARSGHAATSAQGRKLEAGLRNPVRGWHSGRSGETSLRTLPAGRGGPPGGRKWMGEGQKPLGLQPGRGGATGRSDTFVFVRGRSEARKTSRSGELRAVRK